MQRTDAPLAGQGNARRLASVAAAGALLLLAAAGAGAQPLQIPKPTGYVNDFANIIDAESEAAITRIADEVRLKSGGEIVVVTLPSLQGRTRDEVGLQILREWGIGKRAQGVGDSTANTGTLLLVALRERQVRIELGYGTNTFITAAEAGRVRDEIILPAFRQGQFGPGIEAGVGAIARQYAGRFGFQLTGAVPAEPQRPATQTGRRGGGMSSGFVIMMLIFFFLFFRGRGGGGGGKRRRRGGFGVPVIIPFPTGGGWGGGGFGGGGGWGGGGGGGFGGGGGGGGGAGGEW